MTGRNDTVVLVHGLAANRLMMKPLQTHLGRCGFATLNWGYPSTRHHIEHHATSLQQELIRLEHDPRVDRIRLVTHSMGGIVARAAILDANFTKLQSLVMLGPPNHGSRVASVLSRGLGWFCKPLSQLDDADDSFVNVLPPPEGLQIGIIAALFDRVVAIDSTHLCTERDHRVVPSGHSSMLFRHDVADHVSAFLREGRFRTQRAALQVVRQAARSADERVSSASACTMLHCEGSRAHPLECRVTAPVTSSGLKAQAPGRFTLPADDSFGRPG